MYKVLHASDFHLGFWQFQLTGRLLDFATVIDRVADTAIEQRVDLVVDTGDTFNSPEPDPMSVGVYRRFVEKLAGAGIPLLAIVGNHNVHDISKQLEGNPSWMEAVSDRIWRPRPPEQPMRIPARAGNPAPDLEVVAFDWMPSDKIDAQLARIESRVDAVFMHQLTEGFVPKVAKVEMTLAQVDGVARYVGVGDVHVNMVQQTPKGTRVGSAGSTELCKSDEPRQKFVNLVEFPDDRKLPVAVTAIPIRSRHVIAPPFISSELNLEAARILIANERNLDSDPLVLVTYDRALHRQVKALKKELEKSGYSRLRFQAETTVEEGQSYQNTQMNLSVEMGDILAEMLAKDPALCQVALDLWSSPDRSEEIIQQLKERLGREINITLPSASAATN